MDPPVNEEKQIFNMIEISKFRSLTMGYPKNGRFVDPKLYEPGT